MVTHSVRVIVQAGVSYLRVPCAPERCTAWTVSDLASVELRDDLHYVFQHQSRPGEEDQAN